jgi:FkbM family methyltransferase
MIHKIINQTNHLQRTLRLIKDSPYKLVMYGAGEVAQEFFDILAANNIEVSEVVIDEDYYKPNLVFNGINIKTLPMILKGNNEINLFIGCNVDLRSKKEHFKANKYIKNVFMIDYGKKAFDYTYFLDHESQFIATYDALEDALSKATFEAFLNSRTSDNPIYISDVFAKDQYFPKDLINLLENEVFVDCGAFNGDTILEFVKYSENKYKRIYGLEPDLVNFNELADCVNKNKLKDVVLIKKGSWNKQETLKFMSEGSPVSAINDLGTSTIEADAIDNIIADDIVSFIKMDVEGAELSALQGASKTIKRYKPKLAICIYHKPEDLITIPQFIKSIVPEYTLYLRAHTHFTVDVVLYAIL